MNAEDLKKLKGLAQAATPGPWEATRQTDDECNHIGYFIETEDGKAISDDGTAPCNADALFIAAANPAVILELIAIAERQASSAVLDDEQLEKIARSYFCDEYDQKKLKNAIHDAFKDAAAAQPAQEPLQWTPGPNAWKDWCTQYFGPDADDAYLAEAVFNLPLMAQRFKTPAPTTVQQPVAYLKEWNSVGNAREGMRRVDLTADCEPWLANMYPTITPLYSNPHADSMYCELQRCEDDRIAIDKQLGIASEGETSIVLAAIKKLQDGVAELIDDEVRLDWLDKERSAYGFEDYHEGNEWKISGPFSTVRQAIDAAMSQSSPNAAEADKEAS